MGARLTPLDLKKIKVLPLAERKSLSAIERILVEPDRPPPPCSAGLRLAIGDCAVKIVAARKRDASVILMYGAHLVKNGLLAVVNRMVERGWITHLATNGAGTIHDWELAFLGRTEESVRDNVATGTFGTWDETGRYINLALLAGALRGEGYGRSLGRFIVEDGVELPANGHARKIVARRTRASACARPRRTFAARWRAHKLPGGRIEVKHPWKATSILAHAFRRSVPLTVHPGIGYDIISNHPMFNGAR